MKMPSARLAPQPARQVSEWSGDKLRCQHIKALIPGCEVRVVIANTEQGGWEAIYFIITKIKNGTYWGVTQSRYRIDDCIGLANGETMTFRREHILEISLGKHWQPRAYVKATKHLPVDDRQD